MQDARAGDGRWAPGGRGHHHVRGGQPRVAGKAGRATRGRAMIHPTAIVHSAARVAATASVGPYCVIGEAVELGEGCELMANVFIEGPIVIGERNRFFPNTVIGVAPQDLKYKGERSETRIGSG